MAVDDDTRDRSPVPLAVVATPPPTISPMASASQQRPIFRLEARLGANWPNLRTCEENTKATLGQIEAKVGKLTTPDTSLVLYGSLARREFTADSDADWTLLVDGQADPEHLNSTLEAANGIKGIGIKVPGREGTFGQLTFSHDLIHYIGGQDDSNTNTTRRILLLLESTSVGQSAAYDRVTRNVLHRYLSEDHGWLQGRNPYGVPRFLQNDIARYWRTMAVDFAYKQRLRGGEGWALRSTKLRLSRKLIYASGLMYCFSCREVAAIAEGKEGTASRLQLAIDHLLRVGMQPPIDIVADVLDRNDEFHEAARAFGDAYDQFLGLMADSAIREHLENLPQEDASTDPTYELVRHLGHRFQGALDRVFLQPSKSGIFELTMRYGVF